MTAQPGKFVYYFGEGTSKDKDLLGGKGANLHEMVTLGLPIPTGFTISCNTCVQYNKLGKKWPEALKQQVLQGISRLQQVSGKRFGDASAPLLVSVRSGAKQSMPGMMDTVLNLGLNETIVQAMAKQKNERFAYDSYRRFIMMFGDVVMNIKREKFEEIMDHLKEKKGVKFDSELNAADLKSLIQPMLVLFKKECGRDFPTDPVQQLEASINAVFDSWENPRARVYRDLHDIPHDSGTAVNVQEMVFGNMGDDCATGVAFTRDPSTGENVTLGEYLPNAQGEDVVAGIRTPFKIAEMKKAFPECAKQLYAIFDRLEKHYKDMQDIEFTIERQKLFILQTRSGKRTAVAAVKMAVEMAKEGLIDVKTAVMRVEPKQLDALLHSALSPDAVKKTKAIAKGLPASPGAAVGRIRFTADAAVAAKARGEKAILVRLETSPEDITGMIAAEGILTARGGMTSHAAVVARGMNVCCVAGCSDITVKEHDGVMIVKGGKTYKEGDWITLDGSTGSVYDGQLPVVDPVLGGEFEELLKMADSVSRLVVMANADTPKDAGIARKFGAKGVGLCRTEHMFFNPQRILNVRQMILAEDLKSRQAALDKLLVFQREDFVGILGEMAGLPVVIRLLDPPLHEFLPQEDKEQQQLADLAGITLAQVKAKCASLHEFNPMLGFRGVRLGIVYPEINAMQVQAIFEASLELLKQGKKPLPFIEVPLVGKVAEFTMIKDMIEKLAVSTGAKGKVNYKVGTMIEVPRAALTADEFASEAEFMSFGTNDLTQMTCGFSRDDSASFLKAYVQKGIYPKDPFESIDQTGVGKLMQVCINLARTKNEHMDFGICGEHGGDPASIAFCHRIGLDNVSCSPFRVPIARLAAGQAALTYGQRIITTAIVSSKL